MEDVQLIKRQTPVVHWNVFLGLFSFAAEVKTKGR